MALSLVIILVLGLFVNALFEKIKLPGLIGILLLGILVGPNGLNLIDSSILKLSGDLRKIALIIILIRAGLGISRKTLSKVGPIAIKIGFIPSLIEGFIIAYFSMKLLGFTFIEGGMLGFIIAAVSPAIVVPRMLKFIESGIGTNKGIPTLILTGTSIDNVLAITVFSSFLGLYSGNINIGMQIFNIPLSIILGIILGSIVGLVLIWIFNKYHIRDTKKVLLILGIGILLTIIESTLKEKIEISSFLGVITIGFVILEKKPKLAHRLSKKFSKIWIFAEIMLFILVGSQVDVGIIVNTGIKGAIIVLIAILARSLGVYIATIKTDLIFKERLFCIISYIPKGTVQATIGAIPLLLGVENGGIILAIAVLSILITAPLGAIGIRISKNRLLTINAHQED